MQVKVDANLNGVAETLAYLQKFGTGITGASMKARKREENSSITNEDVIGYLATGNSRSPNPIQRDIRFNESERDRMTGIFTLEVKKKLALIIKRNNRISKRLIKEKAGKVYKTPPPKMILAQKMAKTAATVGLRKAMVWGREVLLQRVESQQTTEDGAAEAVGAKYAKQRSNKYGVPNATSLVFKASGQLTDNLARGAIKIHREPGFAQKLQMAKEAFDTHR